MRRLIAVLMALVCITPAASAEFDPILMIKYNAAAQTVGAPQLDGKDVRSKDAFYLFTEGQISIAFEMSADGVKNGAVYAQDDSCAADFLCSCMAMLWTLGDIDTTAAGMILSQYASIRAGKDSVPYNLGQDAFQIVSGDYKYSFIYMNNDGKLR